MVLRPPRHHQRLPHHPMRTRLLGFQRQGAKTRRPRPAVNPKGIASSSPGLRGTSYPGKAAENHANPNGVAACARIQPQPRWGWKNPGGPVPKVARASQPWALSRNPVGILRLPATAHRSRLRSASLRLGVLALKNSERKFVRVRPQSRCRQWTGCSPAITGQPPGQSVNKNL